MKITCPHCGFSALMDDDRIPDFETVATCPSCENSFRFAKGTAGASPDATEKPDFIWHTEPPKKHFFKTRTGILSIILACLILTAPILNTLAGKVRAHHDEKKWRAQDAVERMHAPSWNYDLRSFNRSLKQHELVELFKKDGFHVRVVRDNGITVDDKTTCWMNVKDFWGIPGMYVGLFFNEQGKLNSIRFSFPPEQHAVFISYLSSIGHKVSSNLGRDGFRGPPIEGWVFDSGFIMTSSGLDVSGDVTGLWLPREVLEKEINQHLIRQGFWNVLSAMFRVQYSHDLALELKQYWNRPQKPDPSGPPPQDGTAIPR